MKTCVYVRCVNESEFLNCFISHYINLGFDMIYVLYYDTKDDYVLPDEYRKYVSIKKVRNEGNFLLDNCKIIIDKDKYEWTLVVDLDEFLILNKPFLYINDIIRFYKKIEPNVNIIQFGWLWAHKFDIKPESLKNILSKRKLFIGKLGNSEKIWSKSMIKNKYLNIIGNHVSKLKGTDNYLIGYNQDVHCVNCNLQPSNKIYWLMWADTNNMRNHAFDKNIYQDGFLLHISTRNICDMFLKASLGEGRPEKKILDNSAVNKILGDIDKDIKNISDENIVSLIKNTGYRMTFPLKTLHYPEVKNYMVMKRIELPASDMPIFSKIRKCSDSFSINTYRVIGEILDSYFIL